MLNRDRALSVQWMEGSCSGAHASTRYPEALLNLKLSVSHGQLLVSMCKMNAVWCSVETVMSMLDCGAQA